VSSELAPLDQLRRSAVAHCSLAFWICATGARPRTWVGLHLFDSGAGKQKRASITSEPSDVMIVFLLFIMSLWNIIIVIILGWRAIVQDRRETVPWPGGLSTAGRPIGETSARNFHCSQKRVTGIRCGSLLLLLQARLYLGAASKRLLFTELRGSRQPRRSPLLQSTHPKRAIAPTGGPTRVGREHTSEEIGSATTRLAESNGIADACLL
jgi:hypothetical protein